MTSSRKWEGGAPGGNGEAGNIHCCGMLTDEEKTNWEIGWLILSSFFYETPRNQARRDGLFRQPSVPPHHCLRRSIVRPLGAKQSGGLFRHRVSGGGGTRNTFSLTSISHIDGDRSYCRFSPEIRRIIGISRRFDLFNRF